MKIAMITSIFDIKQSADFANGNHQSPPLSRLGSLIP